MAFLTTSQMQDIKLHMIEEDSARLSSKYRSKKTAFDTLSVDLNEVESYEKT